MKTIGLIGGGRYSGVRRDRLVDRRFRYGCCALRHNGNSRKSGLLAGHCGGLPLKSPDPHTYNPRTPSSDFCGAPRILVINIARIRSVH